MTIRFALPGLVAAALCLAACAHAPAPTAAMHAAAAHVRGLDASGLADLDGNPVSPDDYMGRPLVLAFLGPKSWDSQAEIPNLIRLADAYASEGVAVVGIGEQADVPTLKAFVASSGITFPLWQDPNGNEWHRRGFARVPAFVFIRRDGSQASDHEGFASRGELLEGFEAIANGKASL